MKFSAKSCLYSPSLPLAQEGVERIHRAGEDMEESEAKRADCQDNVHKLMRLVSMS